MPYFSWLCSLSQKKKRSNPWLNFLYSLLLPLAAYLFSQIILPLWQLPNNDFWVHIYIVGFVAISVLFLFFVFRGIYILITTRNYFVSYVALFFKIVVAILFPIIGLCLNNGNGFENNLFGNFSDPWFYILAIGNGIILSLPTFKNYYYRLTRFLRWYCYFPISSISLLFSCHSFHFHF
jgi:hypothetical protein